MKLVFASDIHGSALYCAELCERIEEERPDRIVLLGDLLYHGPRNDLPEGYAPKEVITLLNKLKDRIIAVRGNCDSEVDQMVLDFPCMADYTTITTPEGYVLFVTHGHLHDVDAPTKLPRSDAFVFGHTHVKQGAVEDGLLMINPGSVSLPKDNERSYAIYEEGVFTFKDLSGVVLGNISIAI